MKKLLLIGAAAVIILLSTNLGEKILPSSVNDSIKNTKKKITNLFD